MSAIPSRIQISPLRSSLGTSLVAAPQNVVYAQPAYVSPQAQPIKGESYIQYIPYEQSYLEYEEIRRQVQVPVKKLITDYYAIQYDTEYIPQIYKEKYLEYVPVERIQQRVEYQAVERQSVITATSPTLAVGTTQIVQAPVVQARQSVPVILSNSQIYNGSPIRNIAGSYLFI